MRTFVGEDLVQRPPQGTLTMNPIITINRRPGMAWRVLQFAPVRLIVAIAAVIAFIIAVQVCTHTLHISPNTAPGLVVAAFQILGVYGVYCAYVRLVERRKVVELGGTGAVSEFGLGVLVGGVLFSATALILWLASVWQFDGSNPWTVLVFPLGSALAAAVTEEILFRGILFRIVEESLGSWLALALSAVIFGTLHGFNPGATLLSSVAIALEAGILLAAAYMYTRRLWLPMGLHFAWNYTEGSIFGASVSGGDTHGLLISHLQGPDILTGDRFGPEASIVAVVVCLVAGVVYVALARRRQRFVTPVWIRG
jgi:uncharacterized protein